MSPSPQDPAAAVPPALPWLDVLPCAAIVVRGVHVVQANAAAAALLGRDARALQGCQTHELFSGDTSLSLFGSAVFPESLMQVQVPLPGDVPCTVELRAKRLTEGPDPGLVLVQLHDVTALVLSRQALEESHAEMQRLALGLDTVLENERRRISIELHDELQQSLVSLQMELHVLGEQLAESSPLAARRMGDLAERALSALGATRRIVNDLRPPILEDLGLIAALQALTRQFTQRSGIACPLLTRMASPPSEPEHPQVTTVLYRTVQEALANVARHAGATEAHVSLEQHDDGALSLLIADNGRGMHAGDRRKPFTVGLLAMEQRLRTVGGALSLVNDPQGGTRVQVLLTDPRRVPEQPVTPAMPGLESGDRVADLLGFLYRTPVGLLQATLDGHIELINPRAAKLLLPFAPHGPLDNLFAVLHGAAPHLRRLAAQAPRHGGVICEGLRLQTPDATPGGRTGLTLHLFKHDGTCLMGVLFD